MHKTKSKTTEVTAVTEAPTGGNLLSRLGGKAPVKRAAGGDDGGEGFFPYVGYFTGKEGSGGGATKAADIVAGLGGSASPGEGFLRTAEGYARLAGVTFFLLQATEYWFTRGPDYTPAEVTFEQDRKMIDGMACLAAIVPDDQGGPLAPLTFACFEVKMAEVTGFRTLWQAIDEASTPEWAQRHGEIVGKVSDPQLRVGGVIRSWSQPNKAGSRSYTKTSAKIVPVTLAQVGALDGALRGPEFDAAVEAYERRLKKLTDLAGAPF